MTPLIYEPDDDPEEPDVAIPENPKIKTPISPKVVAGGSAGILTTAVATIAGYAGLDLPAEVVGAAVVLISFVASYLTPDRLRLIGATAVESLVRGDGEHRA